MKPPRCPKCRALPDEYVEVWSGHAMIFKARLDGFPEQSGDVVTSAANPTHVRAHCGSCKWTWRLREVMQITELQAKEKA